jgi:hypothetical protein
MVAQGRLRPEMVRDTPKHDGFYSAYTHPAMRADELEAIHRRLYHEEFARLGPSVFRVVDDYLAGYLQLRDAPAARVRAKADKYREIAHRSMALLPASKRHLSAPNARRVDDLFRRLDREVGPMTLRERLLSKLVGGMIRYTDYKMRHDIGQQPEFTRRSFRMPAPSWMPAPVRTPPFPLPEA